MTQQDIIKELLALNVQAGQARETLSAIQHKINGIVSQLYVFGFPQAEGQSNAEPTTASLPARPAGASALNIAGAAAVSVAPPPAPAATPTREPAAVETTQPTLPQLDLSDPALQDVPQSTGSRLQLVSSTPARESTAPAAVPTGPTRETPEARKMTAEELEAKRQEQVGHLYGTGSLFARYLSPQAISCGKGMLRPDVPATLAQYKDDAAPLSPNNLQDWPTGFYRDRTTSQAEFLLKMPHAMVMIADLSQAHLQPVRVARYHSNGYYEGWVSVDTLPLMELLQLKEAVELELKNLVSQITLA